MDSALSQEYLMNALDSYMDLFTEDEENYKTLESISEKVRTAGILDVEETRVMKHFIEYKLNEFDEYGRRIDMEAAQEIAYLYDSYDTWIDPDLL